jgi:2-polyprenyl-3-methyl-5-hydroxy-6-metoxy-1,4-benzoquinol methylase
MEKTCYVCGSKQLQFIELIEKRPSRETDFHISEKDYRREVFTCNICGVYNNFHSYDFSSLYAGSYNASTYQNHILDKYNKIMSIPYDQSDNKHRVDRIVNFLQINGNNIKDISVLDIGSGLCVFLGLLKNHVGRTAALDPDSLSAEHALINVGVDESYCGHLGEIKINGNYDLIALNKVLEHVTNPVVLLREAGKYLSDNGLIYIELPDGEAAIKHQNLKDREEFFIEHYTIFNEKAFNKLAHLSGFEIIHMNAIHEPSDKFTLLAFLRKIKKEY